MAGMTLTHQKGRGIKMAARTFGSCIKLENGNIELSEVRLGAEGLTTICFGGQSSSWPPRLTQMPSIYNVIFNPPATIIYWADGTKTVVKCGENDSWDAEKGLAMAVAKKAREQG